MGRASGSLFYFIFIFAQKLLVGYALFFWQLFKCVYDEIYLTKILYPAEICGARGVASVNFCNNGFQPVEKNFYISEGEP